MTFINNKEIYLGISEKTDGPMKYLPENRLLFFKNKNLENKIIVSAELVHKNKVVIVDNINKNKIITNCDALITNQNKYLLTVTVSDCLPIYFYDNNKRVVAIAHAGWRGAVSEIAKEVVSKFINHYNSEPTDIKVFIGPHIKDCCFEIKEDVASQFKISYQIIRNQKTYLSLSAAVTDQLIESGVPIDNIKISDECTYCSANKYFSHRRDKNTEIQAMIAYIGLK